MQIFKQKIIVFSLGLSIALMAAITLTFSGFRVWAQFGGPGAYGTCAYGEECPEAAQPTEPTRQPSDPSSRSTAEPTANPSFLEKLLAPGKSSLKEVEALVTALPTGQQKVLPYYVWIVLLTLSIILVVEAIIDRYRAVKLSGSIDKLRATLREQKNFHRVVLHNLNTPLATIKSSVELLESGQVSDAAAVSELKPIVSELAGTIDTALVGIGEEAEMDVPDVAQAKRTASFSDTLRRWYFIVPVVLATLIGVFINWLLSRLGIESPRNFIIYQFSVAILVVLIFVNAVRLFRIARALKKVLGQTKQSAEAIRQRRSQIITNLTNSLSAIVQKFKANLKLVSNPKVVTILGSGVGSLEEIAFKVDAVSRPLSLSAEECVISALVTQVIAKYQPQITEKNLTITTNYQFQDSVALYKKELELALDTAIDNAVQYSIQAGTINIETIKTNGALNITITDQGIGMNEAELSNVFEPFYKGEDVLQYDHEGLGLSLYVSRLALERVDGTVSVQSHKNKGTEVTISLPIARL